MALVHDLSRAQIAFQATGHDVDEFLAVRFRGSEGISQLYRFEIEVVRQVVDGKASTDLVGQPAVLSVQATNGQRWFHGIVNRMEFTGNTNDQLYYRVEMVPSLWQLTQRYQSRIFQNKDIKEIITEVLTDAGIASDRFKFVLSGTYDKREYCVQYRETDFNFFCRLLEQEGIWFFFEQTAEAHTLVMADSKDAAKPIEGDPKLPYRPTAGLDVREDHIFRLRTQRGLHPGQVGLTDFDFKNPKLDLTATDSAQSGYSGFFDFPGEYDTQARGSALATIREEEFGCRRWSSVGQTNCARMAPGHTYDVTEHPITEWNGTELIVNIIHEGKEPTTRASTGVAQRGRFIDARVQQSLLQARQDDNPKIQELAEALLQIVTRLQSGDPSANRALTTWLYHAGQVQSDMAAIAYAEGGSPARSLTVPNLIDDVMASGLVDYDAPTYVCRFESVPAWINFRPPRVTPWPVVRGCQTARIVGPDGEEIHTDEYGRVRVQFNWDLQGLENGQPKRFGADSSCWIRVSQGMAGGQYGIMFLPRVGQEVVVDFLEGNPDHPLVVGRVFNADHMPPYKLPDEKTKSVIKTNSSKGGGGNNEIRFEDLKDSEQILIQAQRQMDTNVKANHMHSVGGSYHLTVGGVDKDGNVYGEYRQKVFKLKQTHVQEERRCWIEKDDSTEVDGAQSEAVGGDKSLTVSKDVIEDFQSNHQHHVAVTYHLKATSIKLEASSGIELVCGGSSIVLTPGGIWIQGAAVNINSGAGAPVSPLALTPGGPALLDEPNAADSSKPGKDTRYSGSSTPFTPPTPPPEEPGHDFVKPTFLEFQLVDADEKPVPNEPYKLEMPDGSIRTGTLDGQGVVRVEPVADGGVAFISLPNRQDAEWRMLRVEFPGAGPVPGGGGTGPTPPTPPGGSTPPAPSGTPPIPNPPASPPAPPLPGGGAGPPGGAGS